MYDHAIIEFLDRKVKNYKKNVSLVQTKRTLQYKTTLIHLNPRLHQYFVSTSSHIIAYRIEQRHSHLSWPNQTPEDGKLQTGAEDI